MDDKQKLISIISYEFPFIEFILRNKFSQTYFYAIEDSLFISIDNTFLNISYRDGDKQPYSIVQSHKSLQDPYGYYKIDLITRIIESIPKKFFLQHFRDMKINNIIDG